MTAETLLPSEDYVDLCNRVVVAVLAGHCMRDAVDERVMFRAVQAVHKRPDLLVLVDGARVIERRSGMLRARAATAEEVAWMSGALACLRASVQ